MINIHVENYSVYVLTPVQKVKIGQKWHSLEAAFI